MRRNCGAQARRCVVAALCLAAALGGHPARADLARPGGSGIYWLEDGTDHKKGDLVGASGLIRTPSGLSMWVDTDLTPGSAETVWWMIFNQPRECAFPTQISRCSFADLATAGAKPSVQYAAGGIVDPFGRAVLTGFLGQGSASGCAAGFPCNGLLDPMEADVHLVIREHGPFDPFRGSEQLATYDGGCTSATPCVNVQAAFHQAARNDFLPENEDGRPVPGAPVVPITISNIRYCRGYVCTPGDQAYVYQARGVRAYNPQGIVDVRPGDTVTWIYQDAWCDVAGAVPYCPGHNVVFEDGGLRSPLLPARSVEGQTFSWTVPSSTPPGTTIPYYCDIFNHMNAGMTGALRVA